MIVRESKTTLIETIKEKLYLQYQLDTRIEWEKRQFLEIVNAQKTILKMEEYFLFCNKNERSIIARFRLGNFMWESEKLNAITRICPLCRGAHSFGHIIEDCRDLEEIRRETCFDSKICRLNSRKNINFVLKFLSYYFSRRADLRRN